MAWDSSLFYRLEDVDTTSPEDGRIVDCRLTKTLLRDAQSGNLIQYEIYSDPSDGTIQKIVSIEVREDGLKLTDYYYQNSQPNFMFTRKDTVYTPTYATIEKVGERYYFLNDTMVCWRMIREPGEVGEYTFAPEEVWYSQADYFAESDEIKGIYDETERKALNAAYNTYDAIAGGESIGMVQGYLRDTTGNGIAGKQVDFRRASDDTLLYQAVTDENGQFVFFVYLNDEACYVKVEGDENYKETVVKDVLFNTSSVTYTYGLTMHKMSGDEYPVAFRLYSCMDVTSDENGIDVGDALGTATATIREGAGNRDGEALMTAETENGELKAELPSGVYTVQFHTEGYLDSYLEVEVMEETVSRDVYVMPGIAESQTAVVLTWDGEDVDLDLTLFTPDQAEGGDMAHIGGSVDQDGKGNILVSDNSSRCEVMFINSGAEGNYKLYVNDYTDSVAGSYASDALYRVNVHIYIYHSDGLVAEYTVPVGQTGVVWEVAEINGKNVTPAQRVYSEISGKTWWIQDKSVWSEEEDAELREVLNNEGSDWAKLYYDYLTTDPHGIELVNWYGDSYNLIYLDDNMIPEIFIQGEYPYSDILLYINSKGVPTGEDIGSGGGEYIPYTGLITDGGGDAAVWEENYRLEKGQLIKIGGWDGHWSNYDNIEEVPDESFTSATIIIDGYELDGKTVTKEQYEEAMNAYVGTGKFQSCVDEWGQETNVLQSLEEIIQGYY